MFGRATTDDISKKLEARAVLAQGKPLRFLSSVLVCLAALLAPLSAQVPLNGSMELDCPPWGLDLHLKRLANGETLEVRMWTVPESVHLAKNKPHPANGRWCSAENQCEAVEATITFKKMKLEKGASGIYVIEFSDGHQQQGSFQVIKKPQPKPFICE